MALMTCEILVTKPNAQLLAGKVLLDGGEVSTDNVAPDYHVLMANLLNDPIKFKGQSLTAKGTPEKWFRALPSVFNGSYLRARIVTTHAVEKFGKAIVFFEKYSEDQARVPAGSPEGGQFAGGESGEGFDAKSDKTTKETYKKESGWVPSRAEFHEKIINSDLTGKVPISDPPVATILGGGTASGKSSLFREMSKNPNVVHIDSDNVIKQLPEWEKLRMVDPQNAAPRLYDEAKVVSKDLLGRSVARNLDLIYNGVGSKPTTLAMVKNLNGEGYKVNVAYVDIPVDTAIERMFSRAANPKDEDYGRLVPLELVRSSNQGAAENFMRLKDMNEVSGATLYSNINRPRTLVYTKENGKETIHDQKLWDEFVKKTSGMKKATDDKKYKYRDEHDIFSEPEDVEDLKRYIEKERQRLKEEKNKKDKGDKEGKVSKSVDPVTGEVTHSYGLVQVIIPQDSNVALGLRTIQDLIPDSDVMGEGKEDEPHITVRYGILPGADISDLRDYLASIEPFEVTTGRITAFSPSKNSDWACPLVVEIGSSSPNLTKYSEDQARDYHGRFESEDAPSTDKPVTLVFSGTFNPPHMGHVQAVTDALNHMKDNGYDVKNVVVVPAPQRLVDKKLGDKAYPLNERVELARRTFTSDTVNHPNVTVTGEPSEAADKIEGKLKRTHTADFLQSKYPDTSIVTITGEDSAPGANPPKAPAIYSGDKGTSHEGHYYFNAPRPTTGGFSSTAIRNALREGTEPPAGALHPNVTSYLPSMFERNPGIKKIKKYSEDQARDDHGRFTSGGETSTPKGDVDAFEKELDVKELKLSPSTSWMYLDTPKGQAGLDIHNLYSSSKPGVEIHWLTAQERGSGRAAMDRVTELADKHGIYVSLWARPLPGQGANEGFTPKKAQLENFYRGFGFEVDRRDNGKYAYMIRAPKTNKVFKYSEDQARDDHGRFASEDETPAGFYPGEEGHGEKGTVKLSSIGILPEGWITKDGEFIVNRDNGGFHARSALQNGLLDSTQSRRVAVNAGETSNIVGYAIDNGNIRVTSENGIAGMQGAKDDPRTIEHMRDGLAHVTSKHIIIELWPKSSTATIISERSLQQGVIRGNFRGDDASENADRWLASGASHSIIKLKKQRPLEDRLDFQGMKISIETDKGSTREGVGKDGKHWSITMTYPYGYIRGTEGVDGDHVDCFIGPSKDAAFAYVIHTKEPSTGDYDEDKVMLGWDSAADAKKAFLDNYTSPDFFQSMDVMPMEEFKEKAFATAEEPAMIKDATTSGITTETGLNTYNLETDGKKKKRDDLEKDLTPLEQINQEVADYADFKPATFDFHPHMTIAYVKPDCGSLKLVGNQILSGQTVFIDSLTITKADGTSEVIKLGTAVKKYSEDQARDYHGRFEAEGGTSAGQSTTEDTRASGADTGRDKSGSEEGISNAYGRNVRGIRTVNVAGQNVAAIPWETNKQAHEDFSSKGITPTNYLELQGDNRAVAFTAAIQASKAVNPASASVYVYPPEDYEHMRLFVTENGKGGVAIKDDGDIVSLFNTPGSGNKGVAYSALSLAVQNGGNKLDCFDTVLPKLYAKAGFVETSRSKWDDTYAPHDWNKTAFKEFNHGEPDIVFMAYAPKGRHLAAFKKYLNDEKTLEYCKNKFTDQIVFKGDLFIPQPPINKYSEDQARVAAGEPGGGQFTSSSGSGYTAEDYDADTHTRVGRGYWGSSHGTSFRMSGYSAQEMGIPGFKYDGLASDPEKKDVGLMLDNISNDHGGSNEKLFHAFDDGAKIQWKVGDTFKLPLTATSGGDVGEVQIYAYHDPENQKGIPTVFEFPKGTRMSGYNPWSKEDAQEFGYKWSEAIVSGEYEVTGTRQVPNPYFHVADIPTTVVTLKPIGYYDTSTKTWKKS
jgi:predicted ABC-type ATPase/2'-5' RNA ligase